MRRHQTDNSPAERPLRSGYRGCSIASARNPTFKIRHGFTLIELTITIGIVIVLTGIFVPFLSATREQANRAYCANNLMRLWDALSAYANDNGKFLPRVVYDTLETPNGHTAFTGADSNPFAAQSRVKPNDVTASLWLLLRNGYLKKTNWFICPSTGEFADRATDATGKPVALARRGNFRSPWNLSYGYAEPFSSAAGYQLNTDKLPPDFALMADHGPPISRPMPSAHAPPLRLAAGNSPNHGGAGQNVLYAAGYVKFQTTPYCGNKSDNIYTAFSTTPLQRDPTTRPAIAGYRGHSIGPSYAADSYLVPAAQWP